MTKQEIAQNNLILTLWHLIIAGVTEILRSATDVRLV